MANKKAVELVVFAEKALSEKWGYVWGASGEVYTQAIAEKLFNAYKTSKYNETYYFKDQMNLWKNRKVCDCSGLFRSFGASGTANDMYNKSTSKGNLTTCDLLPGTLIFCAGSDGLMNHIGVLVDGGYVIHSTNSATGVIKEKLSTSKRGWTHWGKANFIDYDTSTVATSQVTQTDKPTLRKGSKGADVKALQELLNKKINAGLVVDGDFGAKTHAAVTTYQLKNNLAMDGVVGAKTWAALMK